MLYSQNWPPARRRHTPQNPDSGLLGSPTVLRRVGCPEGARGAQKVGGVVSGQGLACFAGQTRLGAWGSVWAPPLLPCPPPLAKPGHPSQHLGPWCPPVCLHVWSAGPGQLSQLVRGPGGLSCWWYWYRVNLADGGSQRWALGCRTPWAARGQHRCPASASGEPTHPGRPPCGLRSWAQWWRHCIDPTVGLITNS